MNERFKEIERQCWQSTDSDPYALFDVKKFAELLIKECAEIADKNSPLSYPDHGIKIKRHFGVEE